MRREIHFFHRRKEKVMCNCVKGFREVNCYHISLVFRFLVRFFYHIDCSDAFKDQPAGYETQLFFTYYFTCNFFQPDS